MYSSFIFSTFSGLMEHREYIWYGPICNPAHFEASRPASKKASRLQKRPAGFKMGQPASRLFKGNGPVSKLAAWSASKPAGWTPTGQLIHQSADGSNSWLQNRQTDGSLANLLAKHSTCPSLPIIGEFSGNMNCEDIPASSKH